MAGHVWVICKLPNGLLLDKPAKKSDGENMAGTFATGSNILLKGQNARAHETGLVIPHDQRPGITKVDKDFWEAWLAEHKEFPAIVNGTIYAVDKDPEKDQGVQREMDDMQAEPNGFEPVDRDRGAPPSEKKAIAEEVARKV